MGHLISGGIVEDSKAISQRLSCTILLGYDFGLLSKSAGTIARIPLVTPVSSQQTFARVQRR